MAVEKAPAIGKAPSFGKTKVSMILAAERLFARKGMDNVSLSEIMAESGQRNASALNYHFGTRTNLIEAIVSYRMTAIDARRQELLDALEEAGRLADLRGLVDAKVRPLAETLLPGSEAQHYVGFLTQIHASPNFGLVDMSTPRLAETALHKTRQHIARAVAGVPEALLYARQRAMMAFTVMALREVQREFTRIGAKGGRIDLDRAIADIIDMQVGALTALPSCHSGRQGRRSNFAVAGGKILRRSR